ncbi:hypothetical protein D9M71_794880 [compost metagenome]
MSAHQFDGGGLIAGFEELDQAQVLVAAAGFMAFVIEGRCIQRAALDQFAEPVEQHRVVQYFGEAQVELAQQIDVTRMVTGIGRRFFLRHMQAQGLQQALVGAPAELGDNADLDQAPGFEH